MYTALYFISAFVSCILLEHVQCSWAGSCLLAIESGVCCGDVPEWFSLFCRVDKIEGSYYTLVVPDNSVSASFLLMTPNMSDRKALI